MSADSMQRVFIDDAQLRYQGLIDHVKGVQAEVHDFPGAVNLNGLVASYLRMATTLFPLFTQALTVEENAQTRREAKHKMVNKLAAEWEIVFQLIANAKLLGTYLNTNNDFSWLNVLVRYAQADLNLSNWDFTVVPKVSMRYALTSFRYAPDFSALEMPVSALNTAWEWSVLWHELAGRISRDMKKADPSAFNVESVQKIASSPEDEIFKKIDDVVAKLQNGEAVGSPLLSQIRKLFKAPRKLDWSNDWVEEIFEDACSVLTFGEDFVPVLDSILEREERPNDKRHPPQEIRRSVALRLLNLHSPDDEDNDEVQIEKDVASHILEIIQKRGLKLPTFEPAHQENVHRRLQELMKKFIDETVTLADTQTFKDELIQEMQNNPVYERKGPRDFSVDVTKWDEVASSDYKKMLNIAFSELDFATPLTIHGSGATGRMSITVHGTIHEFIHGFWNHK